LIRRTLVFAMTLLVANAALADDPLAEAKRHFDIGFELVDRHAWDAALAELLRSYELHPTAAALKDVAICRRELGRFDEALDAYEQVLARFGAELSADERRAVDADVARIMRFVGALDVTSDPPALVFVDDRERGATPLAHAIRVTVGTRHVRVVKDGYAPFEAAVIVSHDESATRVAAKLAVVSRLGRLRVTKRTAPPFDVLVDGAVVGRTPWEGQLAVGTHAVSIRHGDHGTIAREVDIGTGTTTDLALEPRVLDGALRIEPTPSDARVIVDGTRVSQGAWSGELPSGEHRVRVEAPWYVPETRVVDLTSRGVQAVRPVLLPTSRAYLELVAGFAVPGMFDVGVRGGIGVCNVSCVGNLIGVRSGYGLTSSVSVELFVFSLSLPHDSATTVSGTILGQSGSARYTENVDASMFALGASLRWQIFDRVPISLHAFVGGADTTLANSTSAAVPIGTSTYFVGHRDGITTFWSPAFGPELRVGIPFGRSIVVGAGMMALFFFTPSIAPVTSVSAIPIPPRPGIQGGFAYALPITATLHVGF
jgi:hypothetical protein